MDKCKSKIKYYSHLLSITILNLFFFANFGCTTTEEIKLKQNTYNDKIYRRDLIVEINGKKFSGTGVIPKAEKYDIIILPEYKIDRVIFQTCSSQYVIDSPQTDGFFKKSVSYTLRDINSVKGTESCGLEITTLNEKTRLNGFATFLFEDIRPEVSLPALTNCNGSLEFFRNGVSLCQSAQGLIQQITFSEPVIFAGTTGECDVLKNNDDKIFTFPMSKSFCNYWFGSNRKINGKRALHHFQTIGYTALPVKDF